MNNKKTMFPKSYNEFVEYFEKNFSIVNNLIFYQSHFLTRIQYKKQLTTHDMFNLWFRFSDSLKAFDFYRQIFDSQDDYDLICHLCDVYNILYILVCKENAVARINKRIEFIDGEHHKALCDIAFNMAYGWKRRANINIMAIEAMNKEKNILKAEIDLINKY